MREDELRSGFSILVKNDCNYRPRDDLLLFNEEFIFETFVVVVVALVDFNLVVISIYTVPNYKKWVLIRFEKLLAILQKSIKNKSVILTGDFNVNTLEESRVLRQFKEIFECMGLYYNIKTRLTQNSVSCLDNIITERNYSQI